MMIFMKKARLYYLFALLFSVVFIFTLVHRVTLVLFFAVILMPAISYLLMRINYAFIKFDVSVNKNIYEKREEAETTIKISNEGIIPTLFFKIRIMQIDDNGKSINENIFAFSLSSFKNIDFSNKIVMKRRGVYEIGIKEVEVYDLLGLFRIKKDINEIKQILVLPKRILLYGSLVKNIIAENGDEKNKSRVGEDRTIISYVRDYHDGDNMNSVHWKLSAKKDDLVVKVYDNPNDNNILIVADMQSFIFDDSDLWEDSGDAVVEAALTLALKCVYENKSCTLYWYDTLQSSIVWYEIYTMADFDLAFNHLAVTKVSFDNITIDTILNNQEICSTHNKIIYTVTQGLDIKSADVLSSLAQYDDIDVSCLCFDLRDQREIDDYIEELTLNNVNAKKYKGNEIEAYLNDFISNL